MRLEHKAALRPVAPQRVLGDGLGEVDLDAVLPADPDHDPASGTSSALSARSSVVLPEPDGPMMVVAVPRANGERNALQHFVVSEGLVYALGCDPGL